MATLLTGGTGFVGQRLLPRLDPVTITSRNRQRAISTVGSPVADVIEWDPTTQPIPLGDHPGFESVINLMGESIAEGRWTDEKKRRIRDSRVIGTRNLVDGLLNSGKLPRVFVSASAIGIYGDSGEAVVEEDHQHGSGFLTDVCEEWEAEAFRLTEHGVRVVALRIGIVLGQGGGALEQLIPIFRWGVGGRLGSGKQWMAWVHVDDLVSLIQWSMENPEIAGPVNATAPNPVRNSEFTQALAKALGRPAILPAPKFAVRLALGEFANSLFFSQRVIPAVALANGFSFNFTNVQNAIQAVVE